MPSRIAVKPLREMYGLSQAEFAKLIPIDTRTVRRWELGEVSPSPLARARLLQLRDEIADHETLSAQVPRRRATLTLLPLGMPDSAHE